MGITRDVSFGTARDLGYLIVRLVVGSVFVVHGSQKLFGFFGGHGLAATLQGMSGPPSNIPVILVWLAIIAEFFGGLGLITGILPRLSALGIFIVMVVAVLKVHLHNGFFMNWMGSQKGEGFEYHLLVMAMTLLILLSGAGRFTILPDFEGKILGLYPR